MTISAAGFGRQINWEDDEAPPGHKLSLKRSVELVASGLFTKNFCPKWIFKWGPTKKIREARDGFAELRVCSFQTRLHTGALGLKINPSCVVIFDGTDQRTEVLP